jgi:serine/threonine protein kinase
MDYCNEGDLSNMISHQIKVKKFFKEKDIWNIFIQMLKGLNRLHEADICHRDIKSSHILLHRQKKEYRAKIGGLSASIYSKSGDKA